MFKNKIYTYHDCIYYNPQMFDPLHHKTLCKRTQILILKTFNLSPLLTFSHRPQNSSVTLP